MALRQSSQDFVRALKAPSDPPVVGGPLKIDIARQTWDDASFYVPNKSEVIMEWVLTKLLKEKGKVLPDNPVLDIRYWTLILDIVSLQDASTAASSRALKTWLPSLLSHIPIAPVVLVFLSQINDLEDGARKQLSGVVSLCLNILWPLGVQKLSVEVILEVWGALLCMLNMGRLNDSLVRISLLITASYRTHLENSSNKKKMHSTFLQSYLQPWLEFVATTIEGSASSLLLENSFTAGIETIFNLDIFRTAQDSTPASLIFNALQTLKPTLRNIILLTLPRIFEAYILAVRKYRNTLFSHGSNQLGASAQDVLYTAGMHFFALCQGLLEEEGADRLCWETRCAVLALVEREHLFHRNHLTAELFLNRDTKLSLQALDLMSRDEVEKSTLAVKCLANITRIDYDLILPSISQILPRILKLRGTADEIFAFLDLLLSYFTKTRTMSTYIDEIVAATSFKTISQISGNARNVYSLCLSGPLLHSKHLDRLAKGLHTFITPGQIPMVIACIAECIKSRWEEYYMAGRHADADDGNGSRKKRKTESVEEKTGDPEILATTFSLSARLASVVMSSFAITSLPREKRDEVRGVLVEFHASLRKMLSKCFKHVVKGRRDAWSVQVVTAAALRLQYALETSRGLALLPSLEEKLVEKMMNALDDTELLPELVLETFRQLLHRLSLQDEANGQATIDKLLEYLEMNFRPSDSCWSGEGYQLTFGEQEKADSALALMHLVLERWLPVIDIAASESQLERLIRVITSIKLGSIADGTIGGLRPRALLLRALHSAQFWELHRIRAAFLAYISDVTKPLDTLVTGKLKSSRFVEAISAYQLLLLFPVEYFTKSSRTDLITRALTADAYLDHIPLKNDFTIVDKFDWWKVLRVFAKRLFVQIGSVDNQTDIAGFLDHLLAQQNSEIHGDSEFASATLDLCDFYFQELLREAEKSRPDQLLKALAVYSQHSILETPSIRSQAFTRMVERLTTSTTIDKLGDKVVEMLRTIHNNFRSSLSPKLSTLATNGFSSDSDNDLLASWSCLLSLGTWLNIRDGKSPFLGHSMASRLISVLRGVFSEHSTHLKQSCVSIFSILLEELSYCTDDRRAVHLDVVIAVYVTFAESLETESRSPLDTLISRISKNLPPSEFARILDLISASLSTENISTEQLSQLVHLPIILLQNHPQNSLKHVQKFATECFNTFVGMPVFITGPLRLRLQVLEFITRHCSDRPSSLRLLDLGSICLLLSRHLAPSTIHDGETAPEIYHKIVAIISALIRLRRDLVAHMLPHLGMVLRQLLLSLRGCRPHLGAKQSSIVMNSQPQWISAVQPLGAEEGKAVARLLETLNTKTIVRSNTSITENLKAESLAKPFSKHAAYVLKAYIEAINDPLCILSSNLRKELQPGLYALCSMMNEYSRDAMMVSALDAGGKTILKALWKEYERQRYVGKG